MSIPVSELRVTNGWDPVNQEWFHGVRTFYSYSCGHCSQQIAMRSDRVRPREHCLSCDRYLCEKNAGCMKGCTPIYDLARDRWQASDKWTLYLPEIMGIEPDNVVI